MMKWLVCVLFVFVVLKPSFAQDSAQVEAVDSAQFLFNNEVRAFFQELDSLYDASECKELYACVYELKDVPYKFYGRSDSGLDCSGFTIRLFEKAYNENLSGGSSDLFLKTTEVDTSMLQEGDLLFFKIAKNRISHVGVYLGNRRFVHTTTKAGVIVSSLDEAYYQKYFYKAGRLKDWM